MKNIKQEKTKVAFKRFGALGLACVLSVAIALTIAFVVPRNDGVDVSTLPLDFNLPMENATVVKDYADNRLQYNTTLERWDCHLAVDLASDNLAVMSIYDGIVETVVNDSLNGSCVKIAHEGGYTSVYGSLDKVEVKQGQRVKKGQQIGEASDTAGNENKTGGHLHFTLFKDGWEVDPNLYLDLQNK